MYLNFSRTATIINCTHQTRLGYLGLLTLPLPKTMGCYVGLISSQVDMESSPVASASAVSRLSQELCLINNNSLMNIFLETVVGTAVEVNHFLVRFWRGRELGTGRYGALGAGLSWLRPLSTHRPDTSSKCGSWPPTSLVRAPRATLGR